MLTLYNHVSKEHFFARNANRLLEKISGNLTHAAAQQVEYSGWLCHPSYKNLFIAKAISKVHKEIPYASWRWSHIPPYAEVDWLLHASSDLDNIHFNYEEVASPILDLHNKMGEATSS